MPTNESELIRREVENTALTVENDALIAENKRLRKKLERTDAALEEARLAGELTGWKNAKKMVDAMLGDFKK